MKTTVKIEKKLKGIDLQKSSMVSSPVDAVIAPITNMPHRDIGINEDNTVGSML